jgi:hypothetical protein
MNVGLDAWRGNWTIFGPEPRRGARPCGRGALKGTMLSPASAGAPMLLIISGSGPTDRDDNNPLGVKAATYRLLAEGRATRDIGTVRIDKRGMFASSAEVADANAVTT